MKKYIAFFLSVLVSMITACSAKETPNGSPPDVFMTAPAIGVTITEEKCPSIEAQVGMQVVWTNEDTVTLSLKLEQLDNSGTVIDTENIEIQPGNFFAKVFNTPGEYRVYCSEKMDGYRTLIVK